MKDLILIALVVGVGYYLLVYQSEPAIKQPPIIYTNSQATQTESLTKPINDDNKDLEKSLDLNS